MIDRRRDPADVSSLPPAQSVSEAHAIAILREQEARERPRGRHPGTLGGSFVVDETGTVRAFDRGMERMLGWAAQDVIGRHKNLGVYGAADELGIRPYELRPLFHGVLPPPTTKRHTRLLLTRKDGVMLDVAARIVPGYGRGKPIGVEVDRVIARFGQPAGVEHDVPLDPVTELPTRAVLQARLRAAVESARERGLPVSVLAVDIDHLRSIYEQGGTARGDAAAREIAGVLRATVRETDAIARLEDGDFSVLLDGASRGDARRVGGRIRASIEETELLRASREGAIKATVSIGAACFPADGERGDELLARAHLALAEAQRLGRNRVWCYVRRPRLLAHFPVYFDGPVPALLGQTHDVSSSGLFVHADDPLPQGSRLALALDLPEGEGIVHLVGRIARRVAAALPSATGLGIEIERLDRADRTRLERYLHMLLALRARDDEHAAPEDQAGASSARRC